MWTDLILTFIWLQQPFEIYNRIATNTIVPHWFDPMQRYQDFFSDGHSPDAIADHLCRGSFYSGWGSENRNLDDLMKCDYSELNLQMLETAFAENAWFAPRKAWIPPGTFLRLGDIVYVTEDGNFQIIANIHDYPSDIKEPVDEWACSYDFTGGSSLNDSVEHSTSAHQIYHETAYVFLAHLNTLLNGCPQVPGSLSVSRIFVSEAWIY